MSETDDTDELILIPPDFFASQEPFLDNPYFDVLDTLIAEVTSLGDRLHSIESKSEPCFASPKTFMSSVRKHYSSDDVTRVTRDGFESTQSTPKKPQARRVASVASFGPRNLNFDNIESKGSNTKTSILQEADQFVINIENGAQAESNLYNHFAKNSLDLKDLEFMLRKIEEQQKTFDVIVRNNAVEIDIKPLSSVTSVEFDRTVSENTIEESYRERYESTSSDSTQLTTLPNRLAAGSDFITATKSNTHKKHVSAGSSTTTAYPYRSPQRRDGQRRLKTFVETDTTTTTKGSESTVTHSSDHRHFGDYRTNDHLYDMAMDLGYARKLDEERMRRQHCEEIIQQLQKKTLELQDRLANAVRVDEAKDDAILRFHKAWEQVAVRLQTLVNERDTLELEIKELQGHHNRNFSQAAEKIVQYESEIKKSYLVMQTTQEKNKEMEKLIIDLTNEIHRLNKKIESLEKELKMENENYKQLKENLAKKEDFIKEANNALSNSKAELDSEKQKVEEYQQEFEKIKQDCGKFDLMVKERNSLIDTLEKQNQKLMTDVDSHKKAEKDLQKELTKTKEVNEKEKLDLKYFYQEQVERVVKEKLLDFQIQLERARGELEGDLKKREVIVAKTAATHIQQIADKHSLEIRLLEEKHTEEVRLYQVQLSQAQQLIDNLQHKLQHQQLRKQHMAKQLHKLMEAQWLEALKIINNGRSPVTDHDLTNQLNLLKSKSYNNMEEVLEMNINEGQEHNFARNNQPLLQSTNVPHRIPHRNVQEMYPGETPLTSRPRKQEVEDIHKYVQMLLQKQAASPTGDHMVQNGVGSLPPEYAAWQAQAQDEDIRNKTKQKKVKPPWK